MKTMKSGKTVNGNSQERITIKYENGIKISVIPMGMSGDYVREPTKKDLRKLKRLKKAEKRYAKRAGNREKLAIKYEKQRIKRRIKREIQESEAFLRDK